MKRKISVYSGFVFIIILSLFIIQCSSDNKYPNRKFVPTINDNRILDSLISVDLNNDGIEEYIILTKENNLDSSFNFYNFDLIEIVAWNSKENNYLTIFKDTAYFGTNVNIINSSKDYSKIISACTFSGGEDSVISSGLLLYGCSTDGISKIFSQETGLPEFKDFDMDSTPEIVVQNTVFFKISSHEPIHYIKAIYKYDQGKYFDNTLNMKSVFIDESRRLFDDYQNFKIKNNRSVDAVKSLILMCLNYSVINEISQSEKLFYSEKEYIYKISEDSYYDFLRIMYESGINCKNEIDSICYKLYSTSIAFVEKKNFKNAEQALNKILDLDPDFVTGYLLLGEICNELKKFDESISYFQQASIFTSEEKRLYIGMGKAYFGKNEYKESKEYFEKYLEMDSLSSDAVYVKNVLSKKEFK